MRHIDEIIVHCSATKPDWMKGASTEAKVAEIRRWHIEDRKWSDIGYHYIVDTDGTVVRGRPLERVGAHVKGHNKGTIGICLIGGHGSSAIDNPTDHFTAEQLRALRNKINGLKSHMTSIKKVSGHNEYANKACPGFNVPRWWKNKSPARETPMSSTTVQAAVGAAATAGAGTVTAVSQLNDTAQIVAVACGAATILFLIWIMRERLKKWGRGVK